MNKPLHKQILFLTSFGNFKFVSYFLKSLTICVGSTANAMSVLKITTYTKTILLLNSVFGRNKKTLIFYPRVKNSITHRMWQRKRMTTIQRIPCQKRRNVSVSWLRTFAQKTWVLKVQKLPWISIIVQYFWQNVLPS